MDPVNAVPIAVGNSGSPVQMRKRDNFYSCTTTETILFLCTLVNWSRPVGNIFFVCRKINWEKKRVALYFFYPKNLGSFTALLLP